jgi:hypothetical protein
MVDFRHLLSMTDSNGLLQFSRKNKPDANSGYTLDDNARALLISIFKEDEELAYCYANYLFRSQSADSWSNFLLNGKFSPKFDSEDSVGRALLACSMGATCSWIQIQKLCNDMLTRNLPLVFDFTSPRAIAYTLLALCKGKVPLSRENVLNIINLLSNRLLNLYNIKHEKGWFWFEDYLTYCNGIMPQALFSVYTVNGDKKTLKIAHESLNFLNSILFRDGYLNIIGNQQWYNKGGSIPLFDQQPVDAASTYFSCMEAYKVTGNFEYLQLADLAHKWFRGKNIHSIYLYNKETGGCYDALTIDGVNLNQGAESTISLIMCDMHALRNAELSVKNGFIS